MRLGRVFFLAVLFAAAAFVIFYRQAPEVRAEDRAAFQSAQPLQQQPTAVAPTLKVYSRETIVDVTVTDAKGNPVHGLTRDDFTVMEDGKPQPIKSFAEFGSAPVAAAKPLPKLPPNVYTNLQPPHASPALNILLIDAENTAPIDTAGIDYEPGLPGVLAMGMDKTGLSFTMQTRVKKEVQKYLKTMPVGTRAAILGLGTHLRTVQGFTSDPELLSAAVDTMQIDLDGRASDPMEWCAQQDMRNRMTLESLGQIAADLGRVKGKKNLLWFGIGSPTLTDPQFRPPCLPDYSPDLRKVYALLAASQVTVYLVDSRGLLPIAPNYGLGPVMSPGSMDYSKRVSAEELSLESFAEATGGQAFYNSNDLAALTAKAISAGADYYTLSYIPPGSEYDGRHHSIKIVAGKPGLKLTYRNEYYAEDPRTMAPTPGLTLADVPDAKGPVDMRTEMGRSMPTSQQILFDVQGEPSDEPAKPGDPEVFGVLDVKLKTKPLTRYGFQYAFPGRQIAFTTAADGMRHGSLEFDLAAYDGDGKVVTSLRQAIELNLTGEQAAQLAHSPFRYFQQLDLPGGALFLRVGVLDRTANKVGTLEIPVTVAKTPAQHAAVGGR